MRSETRPATARSRHASRPSSRRPVVPGLPTVPAPMASAWEWESDGVYVHAFSVEELGNLTYLIGSRSSGQAAVVDPVRDVGMYLDLADSRSLRIAYVLDTHVHNDFISGGRELADLAGAALVVGEHADLTHPHRAVRDGEELPLGGASIEALATPGHTPEHVSYLLRDGGKRPLRLFSGGSLMVGTAARPDLLGPKHTFGLAREEFRTLRDRLGAIPNSVTVHPTHAGGSFCASGAAAMTHTTLARERKSNPLFRARSFPEFLAAYLRPDPYPRYYGEMRGLNQQGLSPLGREPPQLARLSAERIERLRSDDDVTIVDTRSVSAYDGGHVPGSLFAGREGPFSAWVGWLVPRARRLVLIGEDLPHARQAQIGLARIGYDNVLGTLDGGFPAGWPSRLPVAATRQATMRELKSEMMRGAPLVILDVRSDAEAAEGSVPGALRLQLDRLTDEAPGRIPKDVPVFVHCAVGYRSCIAVSLLEQLGYSQLLHISEGPASWQDAPISLE